MINNGNSIGYYYISLRPFQYPIIIESLEKLTIIYEIVL